jgi:hypothetical protein
MVAYHSTTDIETPSATKAIATIGLSLLSALTGIVLVELFCHFFVPSVGHSIYEWERRVMFFDGAGSIFQNHGAVFTYTPHNDIRSIGIYFSDQNFDVEYDYRFRTNNLGLVQDADVEPGRSSLLVLGDSFTEGQGAAPWFRQLVTQTGQLPYQLINGGLLGTGFAQWNLLDRYLATNKINTKKLLVLFISDDYRRAVGNIRQEVASCLDTLSACSDRDIYMMYRLPPAQDLPLWVDRIRTQRSAIRGAAGRAKELARTLLPATHQIYRFLKAKFSRNAIEDPASRVAIAELVQRYGAENVTFVHLPQKDETSGPNEIGRAARSAIEAVGGKLYDGFELCGLTQADYHVHDGHPNAQGYGKIARCVAPIVRGMAATDRK